MWPSEARPTPGGEYGLHLYEVWPAADLTIEKNAGQAGYMKGDVAEFTLTVTNNGPADASGVQVFDTLPGGLEPVRYPDGSLAAEASNFATIGYDADSGLLSSFLGDMGAGATVEIKMSVQTASAGEFTNTATVIGMVADPDSENNSSDFQYRVVDPEATATSGSNFPSSATAGDPVNTFTGELIIREASDLFLPGPMPVYFQRYYASGLRRAFVVSRVGDNWRHNFDWTIHWVGNVLAIKTNEGLVIRYLKSDTVVNTWVQQNNLASPHEVIQVTQESVTSFFVLDPQTNHILRFTVPSGFHSFRLTEIRNGRGCSVALSYNDDGDLVEVTDGLDRTLTFTYDENANNAARKLRIISDGIRSVQLTYDGDLLTQVRDPTGSFTEYAYDKAHTDSGLLKYKQLPGGTIPIKYMWDDMGKVASQTDAEDHSTTFSYVYGIGGATTTVTGPTDKTSTHEFDASGRLTKATNAAGEARETGNDAIGLRSSVTQPLGGICSTTFDSATGNPLSATNAAGTTIQNEYVERTVSPGFTFRELSAVRYPDDRSLTFTYDTHGYQVSYTDRGGNTWTRTFNDWGQLLTVTNPLGGVETHTYNTDGTRATTTDAAGNTTSYEYDTLKRLTRTIHPDETFRSFTYDNANRLTSVTDESGASTLFTHDQDGDVMSVEDPNGNTETRTYDSNGRLASVTDRTGAMRTFSYNSTGLLETLTLSSEEVYSVGYDDAERLTSLGLPDGSSYNRSYDTNGRLTGNRSRGVGNETVTLSNTGQILTRTDAEGYATEFTYDVLGRILSRTSPTGKQEVYTYSDNDTIETFTIQPLGLSTSMQYNALKRLTSLTDPNGNKWTYTYDNQGRTLSSTDPLGNTMEFSYNSRNRLSETVFPGELGAMNASYNASGHLTRRLLTDGTDINFSYDSLGRLTALEGVTLSYDAESRIVACNGIAANYIPDCHRMSTLTLAPGKTVTYTYNTAGQVTRIQDWADGELSFTYDSEGQIATIARSNGTETTLTYDANGRVINIRHGSLADISLTRDASGRPTAAMRDLPVSFPMRLLDDTHSYSYDEAGHITQFTYDDLGRLIEDDRGTYAWDLASRLKSYTRAGNTVTFTQNGFGHLLTRTARGTTRSFVWNYAFPFPAISIVREAGNDQRYFVHHPYGMLLYSISATDNSRWFYHFDERGNTVLITDSDGAVIAAYAYSPYGAIQTTNKDIDNPFTFGGQYGVIQEANTGLYLMTERFYDSQTQRFLSMEPLTPYLHPLTTNPYQYAAANPMSHVDPLGKLPNETDAIAQEAGGGDALGTFFTASGLITNAIDSVGTVLGNMAEETAKAASRALGSSLTLGHAAGEFIDAHLGGNEMSRKVLRRAEEYMDEFTRLDKQANRLAGTSDSLKTVGKIGDGLGALSAGYEVWKFREKSSRGLEGYKRLTRSIMRTWRQCDAEAFETFEKQKNSEYWLRKRLIINKYNAKRNLLSAELDFYDNLGINLFTTVGDAMWNAVPYGDAVGLFGGTEAIANCAHRHIWAPIYNSSGE